MNKTECIHHWSINNDLQGRCLKCPATRDFKALQLKHHVLYRLRQEPIADTNFRELGRPPSDAHPIRRLTLGY